MSDDRCGTCLSRCPPRASAPRARCKVFRAVRKRKPACARQTRSALIAGNFHGGQARTAAPFRAASCPTADGYRSPASSARRG
ncbi:hypothetical protein [Lysobacter gummosus]|uniref:hypothetical protein n=1 Tax=Lysobacter gummosus TaxID=262324 RepID=UPI0036266AA6